MDKSVTINNSANNNPLGLFASGKSICESNPEYEKFLDSFFERERVEEFFLTRLNSEKYWLIVFMDRRSTSLLRLFRRTNIGKFDGNVTVVSQNALPRMVEIITNRPEDGKKILLLDDILIHGRAIQKVWNFLVCGCGISESAIDVDVYGYCVSPRKTIEGEIKRRILPTRMLGQEEWRSLSCNFTKLLYNSGLPYAAFVSSYEKKNIELNCIEELRSIAVKSSDIHWISLADNDNVIRGIWMVQPSALTPLITHAFVRVIYSKETKILSLIPFVLTKAILRNALPVLMHSIAHSIPETYKEIRHALNLLVDFNDSDVKDPGMVEQSLEEFEMRLLNCILSVWLGAFFRSHYLDEDVNFRINTEILRYSFSVSIAEELGQLEQLFSSGLTIETDNMNPSLLYQFDNTKYIHEEESHLVSELRKCQDSHCATPKWIIDAFFAHSGQIEEQNIPYKRERMIGLSMNWINYIIGSDDELIGYLIDAWDRGVATLSYHSINGICEAFCAPGEQSFQYYLRRYKSQIENMRKIAMDVWRNWSLAQESLDNIYGKRHEQLLQYVGLQDNVVKADLMRFLAEYENELPFWSMDVV